MQGTVTISLKDYESLKDSAEKMDKYLKMVCRHIQLFETLSKSLSIEDVDGKTITAINEALNEWNEK